MPNEIYHRSEWGNPKAEGFGDVYFDASATNKLYNHSDYYENSDGTDKILRDIPNKASIVLTPTAYSDGSLNTVIPPYQVLPQELVTNGDFSDGTNNWTLDDASNGSISVVDGKLQIVSNGGAGYPVVKQGVSTSIGKKYSITFSVTNNTTGFWFRVSQFESNLSGDTTFYANDKTSIIKFKGEFTAISTTSYLKIFAEQNDAGSFQIDDISIKEIQEADFDFSRGSSATRVNEKGLIEDVQILSGELVQNGDFEEIGSELVTNGNFDTDSDWTLTANVAISGGKLNFTNATTNSNFAQQVIVAPIGKTYKITLEVSNLGSGQSIKIRHPYQDTTINSNGLHTVYGVGDIANFFRITPNSSTATFSIDNVSVKEVGQNWTLGTGTTISGGAANFVNATEVSLYQNIGTQTGIVKVEFTVTNYTSGTLNVYSGGNQSVGVINVSASALGTYTTNVIRTGGNNNIIFGSSDASNFTGSIDNISVIEITDDTDIPRIDYTSGQGALLLEPQSTNLITYSEDLSQWDTGGTTPVVTAVNNALTGQTNAYIVEDNDASVYERIQINATTTAAAHTLTVFIKKKTSAVSSYSGIQMQSGNKYIIFDSYNGTYNTASGNDYTEISVDDYSSYWRLKVTSTTSSGSIRVALWGAISVDGTSISANATGSETFYGAQLEQKSFATSYIKTEGSAVTRSADVANNSGNADLFNDSEGVLYAEMAALEDVTTSKDISILNDSGNYVIIRAYTRFLNVIVRAEGSTQFFQDIEMNEITSINKFAVKYKQNDFALWVNGVERLTDTSGNTPTGLNRLAFDSGGNRFYGKVKSVAAFKEALTDAELESLTSWISFVEMATDLEYTLE